MKGSFPDRMSVFTTLRVSKVRHIVPLHVRKFPILFTLRRAGIGLRTFAHTIVAIVSYFFIEAQIGTLERVSGFFTIPSPIPSTRLATSSTTSFDCATIVGAKVD